MINNMTATGSYDDAPPPWLFTRPEKIVSPIPPTTSMTLRDKALHHPWYRRIGWNSARGLTPAGRFSICRARKIRTTNMSTERQITANRENATHSTGPRTEEGKATSSRNNTRHGLAACGLIVLPGQQPAFEELASGLRLALIPQGTLQETIFIQVLTAAWNLHRCRLAEAQLYIDSANPEIDPLLESDDKTAAMYARINKYARQNENSLSKALRQLGKLQTEVQYRHEAYPLSQEQIDDTEKFEATPHSLSAVCDFNQVMASVTHQQKTESNNSRKEVQARTAAVIAQIHALGNPNFQLEPDELEAESLVATQAA
jgi:hypothetical protein